MMLSTTMLVKETILSRWCWGNWVSTCRRIGLDLYLSPCTKPKPKWIKDLKLKPKTLKMLEGNIGSALQNIGEGRTS